MRGLGGELWFTQHGLAKLSAIAWDQLLGQLWARVSLVSVISVVSAVSVVSVASVKAQQKKTNYYFS